MLRMDGLSHNPIQDIDRLSHCFNFHAVTKKEEKNAPAPRSPHLRPLPPRIKSEKLYCL